jgi:hypothetical protein
VGDGARRPVAAFDVLVGKASLSGGTSGLVGERPIRSNRNLKGGPRAEARGPSPFDGVRFSGGAWVVDIELKRQAKSVIDRIVHLRDSL